MNNPFDLLKLYHVAQLQEDVLTEGTYNNFDFFILDLSEINRRRKQCSKFISDVNKNILPKNNFNYICRLLAFNLKDDLNSIPNPIKRLLNDSDNEILLVHTMSAYFNLVQDNKKSSHDIISDYLNIIQKNNELDSRTPKQAVEQLKRNICACSIFPYLNEAAGYTFNGEKITSNWIKENVFNSITDNLMLDIFLTHNKKSLLFQPKYLNEQNVDSEYHHVNRIPSYQYQLEQLNLLIDGCKTSLIPTNSDTDKQKINKLISQYTFEIMTNANYLYLTSIITPILKDKESKAHNEITNYLLDRFYGFISLLSLLPYPRLQYNFLIYFSNEFFKFFKPTRDYYEVSNRNIEYLFKIIPEEEKAFREKLSKIIEEIDVKNDSLSEVSIFKAIDDANNILILLLRYSFSLEYYLKTYIELGENKREELVKTIQTDLLHEIAHINNIFLFESNHEHILPSVFCDFMEANDDHYHFDKDHFFDIIPNIKRSSNNRPEYQNKFALYMSNNFALTFPAISSKFHAAESIFSEGAFLLKRYNLPQ